MKKIILLSLILITMSLNAQHTLPPSSVTVTGEGIVNVIPDKALIRVSAEHSGKEATTVKQENDTAIDEVINFCKKLKIESKDLKTERINLSKNYDYQSKTYKYVANQSITIKLDDLEKYESLMQGLLNSGINRIDAVSFESSKSVQLESEARKRAMLNAKEKAVEYAAAVGQEVGLAIHISETGSGPQPPVPMYRASMAAQANIAEKQTIAPGELEIRVEVNVVFELN